MLRVRTTRLSRVSELFSAAATEAAETGRAWRARRKAGKSAAGAASAAWDDEPGAPAPRKARTFNGHSSFPRGGASVDRVATPAAQPHASEPEFSTAFEHSSPTTGYYRGRTRAPAPELDDDVTAYSSFSAAEGKGHTSTTEATDATTSSTASAESPSDAPKAKVSRPHDLFRNGFGAFFDYVTLVSVKACVREYARRYELGVKDLVVAVDTAGTVKITITGYCPEDELRRLSQFVYTYCPPLAYRQRQLQKIAAADGTDATEAVQFVVKDIQQGP
jgi:hypothetical protein